jgi:formate dehydrogenase major subunit
MARNPWQRLRETPGVGRVADWGMGPWAASKKTKQAGARIAGLKVTESICPYCAVGCGQLVYVKDGRVSQIEGDPDSPISRGRLCPKGSASKQLVTHPGRQTQVLYRRPHGTEWERLDLETAMDMIADRVVRTRRETWQQEEEGKVVRRTMGIAGLGGATLDNEENYLMKKLYTAMGAIQVENQARI